MKFFKFTLAMLLFATAAYCQNCAKTYSRYDEMKNKKLIMSDEVVVNMACSLTVFRIIDYDKQSDTKTFCFKIGIEKPFYSPKGIFIKFDDGTIIKNLNYPAQSGYEYYYYCIACYEIPEDQLSDFLNKKVVKVQVDQFAIDIKDREANQLKKWFACVFNASSKK